MNVTNFHDKYTCTIPFLSYVCAGDLLKLSMTKYILLALMALGLSFASTAQKSNVPEWGLGVAGIYDFQTEGLGGEMRADFHVLENVSIVPEVSYYFSFNPIHELYAGLSVHYLFPIFRGWSPYLSASALYNNWINATEYSNGLRKPDNFTPEAGIGIVRSRGCLRPFIENRYDTKWKEANLRVGVLLFFKNCNCFKKADCPAYR
jgi:hypothetical protein